MRKKAMSPEPGCRREFLDEMAPADTHPTDTGSVVRWGENGPELVGMRWGWEPRPGADPVINIRAETADLSANRCLIPASEFFLFTGAGQPKRRWRVTLKSERTFFFAGLWREASDHWPESYAGITIDAARDLEPLVDRQMAVITPAGLAAWFADEAAARSLLKPLPGGSYRIEEAS